MARSFSRSMTIYKTVTADEATANTAVIDVMSGTLKATDAFVFQAQTRAVAGTEKAGGVYNYSTSTGLLTVTEAGSYDLASGDLIVINGVFVK